MGRSRNRIVPLVVEELEPRILYSADAAVLFHPDALMPQAEIRSLDAYMAPEALPANDRTTVSVPREDSAAPAGLAPAPSGATAVQRGELIFVDPRVADAEQLISGLTRAGSDGKTVEVIRLDRQIDGILQISDALAGRTDIAAMHLLSHGADGRVELGAGVLDFESLRANAARIAAWSNALTADADILIYGCDVAQDADGRAFVDALGRLTGTDVAASVDLTGNSAWGGNWNLEYQIGRIESGLVIDAATQQAWDGTLANNAPTITNGATVTLAGTNEDTISSGTTVATILTGASWADADASALKGVAITSQSGNGSWQYSTDGVTWAEFGSVSATNALLLTSGTQVRYVPDGLDGETATFGFKAWDQTIGTASTNATPSYANPGAGGGTTAYSSESATASITVASVNDAPTVAAWYNSGWADRKQITIDHTKVSGGMDLTDFPVLINLGSDANLAASAQANGNDILFTSADGTTRLSHEIETFTSATGALVAWVKVPVLSANIDTVLYMYYGNGAAGNQQNAAAVWSNGYAGVWHLDGSGADSTSNANNGTLSGPTATSGVFGQALNFNGTSDYVHATNAASLQPTAALTLEGWINSRTFGSTDDVNVIIRKGDANPNNYELCVLGQNAYFTLDGSDDAISGPLGATTLSANTWYYVVGTWNGTTANLYINGLMDATAADTAPGTDTRDLYIGGRIGSTDVTDGLVDEARISNVARSMGWIKTQYSNESSPGTFASVGAQQAGTGATVTLTGTNEDTTSSGTTASTILTGASWGDVDTGAAKGIAITSKTGNGSWQYSIDGVTWTAFGAVASNNALLITPATQVRYIPDGTNGETATFGFVAWDQTSGTAATNAVPSYANPGAGGGSTAYSSQAATASLTINSVNDAPTVTDRALSFDGTDLVVVAPQPNLVMTSTLTIEAMVQRTGALTGTQIILNKEGEYEIGISVNGKLQWAFDNTTPGWNWVETSFTVPTDTWVHVAVTFNSGVVKVYANGALVDSYNGAGNVGDIYPALNDLTIGGRQNSTGQRFVGLIDEVRVWNVDRSGAQIQAAYNTVLAGNEAGLVGYWRFSESAGATAIDSSTSGYNGVLGNGVGADSPTRTTNLDYTIAEDTLLSVATPGVLTRATDPEGGALTATLVSGPSNAASFTLNANGSFSYTPSANFNGVDSFVFTVNDGSLNSQQATVYLNVTAVNDAPTITNGATVTLTATDEDTTSSSTTANTILTSASWADVDTGAVKGIAITSQTGNGTWQYSTDGVTWASFGAVASNNALLITSTTQVRYIPDGQNGETATFGFKAWDQTSGTASTNAVPSYANPGAGGGTTAYSSQSATASMTVNPVNDAPTIANGAIIILAGTDENTLSSGTTANSILTTASWADVDTGSAKGIGITSKTGNGTWQYSTDGVTWTAFGAVASNNALLIASTTQVRYIPDGLNAEAATFGFKAWDQTTGTASVNGTPGYANPGAGGGSTAYSSQSGTALLAVAGVNDAPVLSGANNLTTILEDPSSNTGTLVSDLIQGKVTDGDSLSMTGIAVIGVDNSNGTWEYSTNGGGAWNAFGSPSNGVARLLGSGANAYVRFVPNANWNGTVTGGITFRAWDRTTGVEGGTADASSNGGSTAFSSATAASNIAVTSVNDAPVGTDKTVTTNEDTGYTFTAADFGFTDPTDVASNAGANALTAVKITTLPGAGTLQNNGVNVTAGQLVTVADINAGRLVFTPASDANGTGYASFTFQVQDNGGTANGGVDLDPSANTITINVTAVNDAPVNSVPGAQSVDEDDTLIFSTGNGNLISIGDLDAGGSALQVTLTGTNGTITLSGAAGLTFSAGDGTGDATMTFTGTAAAINSALNGLSFAPTPDFAGAASLQIVTNDQGNTGSGGAQSDTDTVAIAVIAENDPPVITSNGGGATASINVAENTTAVATVTAADPEAPAVETLVYSIIGGADSARFAINGTTGVLTFIVAPDYDVPGDANADNVYDVTVQVSDGTLTDTQAIAVTVTAVNDDAPVITSNGGGANASVNVAENTTAVTTVTATDADLPAQLLTYSIAGGADAAKFTIDSTTGALSFLSTPDYESPTDANSDNVYSLTVQVSDGTLTDTQAIAVTVTAVNDDAPVITSNGGGATASANVAENATAVTTVTATDADLPAQSLTYSIVGGADAAKFTIDAVTGALSFVAAPNFEVPADADLDNVYQVTVQVSDGSLTDTQAISVTVTAVNDNAPVITSDGGGANASVNVAENATAITTVTATDADLPAQSLTYSIVGGADAARFTIDAVTGALSFVAAPDFEVPADADLDNVYQVTVLVSDGTLTDAQAITVTVTAVIDNAPVITSDGGGATASVNVAENATAVTTVTATDADLPAQSLTYSIVGGADAAKFTINAVTGTLSFIAAPDFEAPTDADLDNVYQVTVQASDGTLTDTQAIAVTVIGTNEAPVLNSAALALNEGQTVSLSDANFGITDVDSASFVYTVSGVSGGYFQLTSALGIAVTTFSSADLAGNRVQLVDDGDETAPAFSVTVNDGTASSNTLTATIAYNPVNDAPVVTGAALAVTEGQAAALSGASITVTDPDSASFTYIVSGVSGGHFELASAPGATVTAFTSADIAGNLVQFVQDGSESAPTFNVRVSDGTASSNTVTASVTYTTVVRLEVPYTDGQGTVEGLTSAATAPIMGAASSSQASKPAPAPQAPAPAPEVRAAQDATDSAPGAEGRATPMGGGLRAGTQATRASADTRDGTAQSLIVRTSAVMAQAGTAAAAAANEAPDGARHSKAVAVRTGDFVAPALIKIEMSAQNGMTALLDLLGVSNGTRFEPAAIASLVGEGGSEEGVQERAAIITAETGVKLSGAVVSAGFVVWALRGVGLLASLLSSIPAWRHLDPVPVLAPEEDKPDWDENDDQESAREERAVSNLFISADATGADRRTT